MPAEEELTGSATTAEDEESESRRRGWVPWIVLVIVLAVVAWLIWTYSDFGKAPDQADKGGKVATQTAIVPDVVGMTKERAARALQDAGFSVDYETSYDAVADPGTVAVQDPPAGERALKGMSVLISVAGRVGGSTGAGGGAFDGGVQVPDVVGLTQQQAEQTLKASGYPVNVSTVYSAEPQGVVFEQSPGGNAAADPGTTVYVTISLGKTPASNVTVPDVIGMTQAEAEAAVTAAGLTPRANFQPRSTGVGRVYQQSPAPGTVVTEKRLVFLLIAVQR